MTIIISNSVGLINKIICKVFTTVPGISLTFNVSYYYNYYVDLEPQLGCGLVMVDKEDKIESRGNDKIICHIMFQLTTNCV